MTERPRHTRRSGASIDAAVRRAVGMRFALPSLRSMLRACSVYANVIAVAVALGIPGGGLRQAAGSAAQAFESAVRATRDSFAGIPDRLASPADLSAVTETEPAEAPVVPAPETEPPPPPPVSVRSRISPEPSPRMESATGEDSYTEGAASISHAQACPESPGE